MKAVSDISLAGVLVSISQARLALTQALLLLLWYYILHNIDYVFTSTPISIQAEAGMLRMNTLGCFLL